MSDDEQELERIEAMITAYQAAWLDLVRIGVVLIESKTRDLSGMKETIDDLPEKETKELLLVAAATAAHANVKMRRAAGSN